MARDIAHDVPAYRRFMPALMPTRTESAVYFEQQVQTKEAEKFVAATRQAHPDLHPTFFHLLLWSMAQMFDRHPRLNRYVAGGRLHHGDGIWITFTAKTALTDEGTLVEIKHRFDPSQSFAELVRDLQAETARARSGTHDLADRELELFVRLPPLARRGILRLASLANTWGRLPRSFVDGDPFFASAFVTNLGSVGLDAAFHHLYEYGTIPIFCTLGAIREGIVVDNDHPAVARIAPLKFTYDERVEDGLYAAHALADFCRILEHPADTPTASRRAMSASDVHGTGKGEPVSPPRRSIA